MRANSPSREELHGTGVHSMSIYPYTALLRNVGDRTKLHRGRPIAVDYVYHAYLASCFLNKLMKYFA